MSDEQRLAVILMQTAWFHGFARRQYLRSIKRTSTGSNEPFSPKEK